MIPAAGATRLYYEWVIDAPDKGWSISYNGINYHIEIQNKTLYIKFRQTTPWDEDPRSWIRNLIYAPAPCILDNGKIYFAHCDYVIGAHSVIDTILDYMISHRQDFNRIEISGNSQGGGIAILIYLMLRQLFDNTHVIAFSVPRIFFFLFFWNIWKLLDHVLIVLARGDGLAYAAPWWLGWMHGWKQKKIGPYRDFLSLDFHEPEYYKRWLR